jgi:hypothetical protein
VAALYEKLAAHNLSFVQLASTMVWLRSYGDTAKYQRHGLIRERLAAQGLDRLGLAIATYEGPGVQSKTQRKSTAWTVFKESIAKPVRKRGDEKWIVITAGNARYSKMRLSASWRHKGRGLRFRSLVIPSHLTLRRQRHWCEIISLRNPWHQQCKPKGG